MTTYTLFSVFLIIYPCTLCFQDCCCIPCEKQEIKWRFFSARCSSGCFQFFWQLLIFAPLSRVKVMENFKTIIRVWDSSHLGSDNDFLFYLPSGASLVQLLLGRVICLLLRSFTNCLHCRNVSPLGWGLRPHQWLSIVILWQCVK